MNFPIFININIPSFWYIRIEREDKHNNFFLFLKTETKMKNKEMNQKMSIKQKTKEIKIIVLFCYNYNSFYIVHVKRNKHKSNIQK